MTKIKTRPYDAAEYLETPEDMAAYLEAALEDGKPAGEKVAMEVLDRLFADSAFRKSPTQVPHQPGQVIHIVR